MMNTKCWFVYVGFCVLVVASVIVQSFEHTLSPPLSAEREFDPYPESEEYDDYNEIDEIQHTFIDSSKFSPVGPSNCSTPVDFIYGEAERGEFPHQALLGYTMFNYSSEIEFRCGGSLISEWYVLTAAHCNSLWLKIVRLGEYNLDDDSDGQQDYEVEKLIKHPNYSSNYSYHDIALVKVTQKVQFNEWISPAGLWKSSSFNITSVVATGFGQTSNENKLMSPKLMKVGLYILKNTQCTIKYWFDRKFSKGIIPEQLCVGYVGGGKDTCNGDSGGPIQVALDFDTCFYYIVGITSFGNRKCGAGDSEAVYTKVESYLDWIESIIGTGANSGETKLLPPPNKLASWEVIVVPEDSWEDDDWWGSS